MDEPKTAAQRQAAYRRRKQRDYAHRLNTYLAEDEGRMLERLAAHYGSSRTDVIGRLIRERDAAVMDAMTDQQAEDYIYLRGTNP